jgi:hypothetical protein
MSPGVFFVVVTCCCVPDDAPLGTQFHVRGTRLGFAVSEGCATFEAGAEMLEKCFVVADDGTPAIAGDMLGLKTLFDSLGTDEGTEFLDAIRHLNGANEIARTKESVSDALYSFVRFLNTDTAAKAKAMRRCVKVAARLYLMGAEFLEVLALMSDGEKWASHFRTQEAPT